MSSDFDSNRLATLALEIKQAIPPEGGFLRNAQIRGDELPIQGDRTGLMLLAVALLLRAIDHPARTRSSGELQASHPATNSSMVG